MLTWDNRVILVDKPLHWTSFDVVKKLKGALKIKKIGHAGTLDPLATGLLILCTGEKTKEIATFQELSKTYEAKIIVGATTASYDEEMPPENQCKYNHLSHESIHKICNRFVGKIMQTPPLYSAVKVKGKRAYAYARAGQQVILKEREVVIYSLQIKQITLPTIIIEVVCSKGTYIRSLAHNIGQELGVGAYLGGLRRTAIGNFHVADAHPVTFFSLAEATE